MARVPQSMHHRGVSVRSEFRLARLPSPLKIADPGVRAVAAEFRHFAECERALDPAESRILEKLLEYGQPPEAPRGEPLLVVPRLGTISPWSSKATDIARNCGLSGIRRIERGTLFFLDASGSLDRRSGRASCRERV